MTLLQSDPARFYPFPFHGKPIIEGGVYTIEPVRIGPLHPFSGQLQARHVTATSYTLVVLSKGYIVSPGSTIVFQTGQLRDGRVYLQQTARLNTDDPLVEFADKTFGPIAWWEMAMNLSRALYHLR
jgi:hypothetical protein